MLPFTSSLNAGVVVPMPTFCEKDSITKHSMNTSNRIRKMERGFFISVLLRSFLFQRFNPLDQKVELLLKLLLLLLVLFFQIIDLILLCQDLLLLFLNSFYCDYGEVAVSNSFDSVFAGENKFRKKLLYVLRKKTIRIPISISVHCIAIGLWLKQQKFIQYSGQRRNIFFQSFVGRTYELAIYRFDVRIESVIILEYVIISRINEYSPLMAIEETLKTNASCIITIIICLLDDVQICKRS